ncbi:hypothetical protein [Planctomonas deserti]|uniref:glycoside hydrolase family 38 N-terminal domain-containing protein n=1 Tax=Planctomonas deserti TaxID=2144185 RepID=UPI000D396129|nr:hypothetical protein [Planctomonas deserti]
MSAIRTVLLLGHTHHDVGYTNSPRIVDDAHRRIVSHVLDLCDEDPAEGDDSFRWTFEVARPVLAFLRNADEREVQRLCRLVAAGRVSVTGGYLNMTQLPSDGEFGAAYDRLREFAVAGIPVRTEQHGDVNGIAWGAVTAMRDAGIDRLLMALNPDHGRAPFHQPTGFWWEGPRGDRVFTWLSTHYGFGEEWGIIDGDVERAERHISAFLDELATRDDYPYDTALVHAANDNRWPTALFLDVVRHWNARHPDVRMRTATVDEALDVLAAQARDADVPVVRGEWSDWWSHGHGSTAREVAVYREARSLARAAAATLGIAALRGDGQPTLATVLGYRRGPVRLRSCSEVAERLGHVDEQLLLYGEHTWGSWETYSKPHSTFNSSSANAKAGFAFDAYDWARDLAVEGFFRALASGGDGADTQDPDAGSGGAAVDPDPHRDGGVPQRSDGSPADATAADGGSADVIAVLNPTERDRTEPVLVEIAGSRCARIVATVPAFGAVVLPVPGPPVERGEARSVETDRYRVRVDPALGGVVSLVDLRSGRELVDAMAGHGLGAVLVETVPPGSTHPMVTRNPKDFHPDHPGPDFVRTAATGNAEPAVLAGDGFVSIEWESAAPGVPGIRTALTLHDGTEAIDVDVSLVKPARFGPESVFVAFPFAVDEPEFLLETAGAVYAADTEQLPDTSKDWYSIQHAVGVSGAGHGVVWGSVDAPLVQLGGIHTGEWARTLVVAGGGTGTYRYRFLPRERAVTREDVRLHGRDLLDPLQARQYVGPVRMLGRGGLTVEPAGRVLGELRPLEDGSVRVRLRNITAEPLTATVSCDGPGVTGGKSVPIAAHGVADVHLRRTHG